MISCEEMREWFDLLKSKNVKVFECEKFKVEFFQAETKHILVDMPVVEPGLTGQYPTDDELLSMSFK